MRKTYLRAWAVFFLIIGVLPLMMCGPWCCFLRRSKPSEKPASIRKPSRLAPLKPSLDDRNDKER
jgi:hypothetical protein